MKFQTIRDRLQEARWLIHDADNLPLPEPGKPGHLMDGIHYSQKVRDLLDKAMDLIRLIPKMQSASEQDKQEAEAILELCEEVRKRCLDKELNNGFE